jgi:hypothetical protein
VPLALLAAEGFGWGPYAKVPRDAVKVLARQLAAEVAVDDVGRLCVPREVARRLLSERDAAEAQQSERAEQARAGLEAQRRPAPSGVPGVEGLSAYESMLAASGAGPGRRPDGRVSPQQEWLDSIGRPA